MRKFLFSFLYIFVFTCTAQTITTEILPETFKKTIPVELRGDLKLVELKNRCDTCEPWRFIDFRSNTSRESVKREKVTVQAGYRAMYSYPATKFFSNTHIEESAPGAYANDKKVVIDAIKHEFARKREQVADYLGQNATVREKMEPLRAKGRDYIELEESTYKGFEYVSYVENVIGLTGSTISQIHIFIPKRGIIVTAYLLRQDKAKFDTIEEFLKLRRDFIEGYIDFLSSNPEG